MFWPTKSFGIDILFVMERETSNVVKDSIALEEWLDEVSDDWTLDSIQCETEKLVI